MTKVRVQFINGKQRIFTATQDNFNEFKDFLAEQPELTEIYFIKAVIPWSQVLWMEDA